MPETTSVRLQDGTEVTVGAVGDGQVLKRNGQKIEGANPSGAPDASAVVKGLIQLSTDLGGTAAAPNVVGLGGSALPANVANGFLKRNAANGAWEEVAYGTASNTVAQGNDFRFAGAAGSLARLISADLTIAANYSYIVASDLEVSAGVVLEAAADAVVEVC